MNMGIPFTITWSFSFHEDGDTIDQREPSPSLSPYEQYVKGNRREVKEFLAEVMVKAPIYSLTSQYLQKLFSQMVKLYILQWYLLNICTPMDQHIQFRLFFASMIMYVLIVISAGKNFQNYIPGCILGNYYGKPDESSRKDPDGNKNYRSNLKDPAKTSPEVT